MATQQLTERDQDNMDAFFGFLLDAFQSGEITKEQAIGKIGHVVAALDKGNYGEVTHCFEQGRKFITKTR